MSKKKRLIKIDRGPGFGSYVTYNIEEAIQELRKDWEDGDMTTDGVLKFSIIEMTEEEVEALPEFMGW